jgi:hypothetical protein
MRGTATHVAVLWNRLPSGIPTTDAEFYAGFRRKVRRLVHRKVIYGISRADAEAEIWCRLLRARVLDKFILTRLLHDPSLTVEALHRYAYVAAYNHLKNVFRTLERRANRDRAAEQEDIDSALHRIDRAKSTLKSSARRAASSGG